MVERKTSLAFGLILMVGVLLPLARASAADSPEDVVRKYYTAYKDGRYAETYDYVTESFKKTFLRTDKPDREAWAKQWKGYLEMAGFKIINFTIYPAKIEGDKATVPNKFESFDKFANQQGVTEYELVILKKEDGKWKVDSQTQAEKEDIPKWFPSKREKRASSK